MNQDIMNQDIIDIIGNTHKGPEFMEYVCNRANELLPEGYTPLDIITILQEDVIQVIDAWGENGGNVPAFDKTW
jgi:hypothetical protein